MDYKIYQIDGTWKVYSGYYISYGTWIKEDIVFSSNNIADCYTWIKAKQGHINRVLITKKLVSLN